MSKRSSVDVGAGGVQANSSPQNNAPNTTGGSTSAQVVDNEDLTIYPRGYPSLSAHMSSDLCFVMFRRFGKIRMRSLLHKQDQLSELERKLYKCDLQENDQINLSSRRHDNNEERKLILAEIDTKMKEYDEALINCNQVFSLPSASVENIRGFDRWIQDNQPLVGVEQKFLQDHGELVAMKEDLFQQGPVIKLARFMAGKFFSPKSDPRNRGSDNYLHYFPDDRALKIARIIVTAAAVCLLLVPVIILCFVNSLLRQMLVIVFFTVGFSASMTMSRATNAEIFGATAAYAAVMVVFLGSVSNPTSSNCPVCQT